MNLPLLVAVAVAVVAAVVAVAAPLSSTTTQAPQYRNAAVTAKMDGPTAKIAVTADVYLTATNESSALLTYTLAIGPDAQADLTWNLAWKAADVSAREAGLKFGPRHH